MFFIFGEALHDDVFHSRVKINQENQKYPFRKGVSYDIVFIDREYNENYDKVFLNMSNSLASSGVTLSNLDLESFSAKGSDGNQYYLGLEKINNKEIYKTCNDPYAFLYPKAFFTIDLIYFCMENGRLSEEETVELYRHGSINLLPDTNDVWNVLNNNSDILYRIYEYSNKGFNMPHGTINNLLRKLIKSPLNVEHSILTNDPFGFLNFLKIRMDNLFDIYIKDISGIDLVFQIKRRDNFKPIKIVNEDRIDKELKKSGLYNKATQSKAIKLDQSWLSAAEKNLYEKIAKDAISYRTKMSS